MINRLIDTKLFFGQFQINYFDYKQKSLEFLLENYSKIGLKAEIFDYSDKDYVNAIRIDIRQTYFQAIETVFEIFFSLLPDQKGKFDDKIIEKITLSELPYSKIKHIANSTDSLNFLNDKLIFPDNSVITLGEYIFYYGFFNQEKYKKDIDESIPAIIYAFHILAKEFSDRREYNSYKHGLRIIPALKNIKILDAKTKKKSITLELKDSMTFYCYDKKEKKMSYITKLFDSERDIRMTKLCSNLIWVMIKYRAIVLNKSTKNTKKLVPILFFGKEEIDHAAKINVKIQDLVYTESKKEL